MDYTIKMFNNIKEEKPAKTKHTNKIERNKTIFVNNLKAFSKFQKVEKTKFYNENSFRFIAKKCVLL